MKTPAFLRVSARETKALSRRGAGAQRKNKKHLSQRISILAAMIVFSRHPQKPKNAFLRVSAPLREKQMNR
jgi:hypothetical protein